MQNTNGLKQFLIPSWLEVAVYSLLSLLVLVLINAQRFWQFYMDQSGRLSDGATSRGIQYLGKVEISNIVGTVTVIIFWAMVGSFIYVLVWLTQNSLTEIKRDATTKISGDMVKHNYMNSVVAHHTFFVTLTILTAASLFFTLTVALPIINTSFYGTVISLSSFSVWNILSGLASILLLAMLICALKILLQIYVRFWRIYIRA